MRLRTSEYCPREKFYGGKTIVVDKNHNVPIEALDYWAELGQLGLQIACDILKQIGITYFLYIKRFADGSQVELTNRHDWSLYYYQYALYETTSFVNSGCHFEDGAFLWSAFPCQKANNILCEKFNINYGITLVYKLHDCNEFFYFAGEKNSSHLLNVYLNQQEMLKKFVFYFRDKFFNLVHEAEKKRIILPAVSSPKETHEHFYPCAEKNKVVLDGMSIERYYITEFSNNYLTQREAECVKWYVRGKTAEEIAMILDISRRTVEVHIEKVRRKLNCFKQSQIACRLSSIVNLL